MVKSKKEKEKKNELKKTIYRAIGIGLRVASFAHNYF